VLFSAFTIFMPMNTPQPIRFALLTLTASLGFSLATVNAATTFTNDFEAGTTGFTAGTQQTLPADNAGFGSAVTSKYLGLFDSNDFTDLTLALTPGTQYTVSFDLFAGRSLDGTLGVGPDRFTLAAGVLSGSTFSPTTTLVDATFANIGATQSYSDTTPTAGLVGSNASLTGADISFSAGGTFGNYGIYFFSHGAGNPTLTFIAPAPSTTLRFAASGLQTEDDEFFALDNVIVTTPDQGNRVPDSGTTMVLFAAALLAMGCIRRFVIA